MNLGKHIHTLLKRKTEVYVAGLGVFKRVYSPAAFDAKKNVFMPPVNYIEFDSLSTDGYDFVTYIQQLDQVDRSEAAGRVEQQVAEIHEELSTSGEVSLDSLGHLVSYGNTAVFKPFDLSGFNFEPVETAIEHEELVPEEETPDTEGVPEEETEPIAESPIVATESERVEDVLPEEERAEEPIAEVDLEEEEEAPSRNRSAVYGLVAALAVLILGGLYYYSEYYNVTPTTVATVPVDTTEQILATLTPLDTGAFAESDTTLLDIDTLGGEDIQVAQIEELPVEDNNKFTIVIGTHRTLAQAYEEAEAFNKDGHNSVRVVTPNLAKNLKRVIWDSYATKEERDSALRYVRKHIKADAWGDMLK